MGDSQRKRIEEILARELVLAVVMLGVAMLQTALLPQPYGLSLNLILLLVMCRGLVWGLSNGARWAFYSGIGLDVCSNRLIGTHALALLVAVLLAVLPLARLSRDNWMLPIVGTLLGALGYHATMFVLTTLLVKSLPIQTYMLVAALPEVLVSLIPALPLFLFMRWRRSRQRGEVQLDIY